MAVVLLRVVVFIFGLLCVFFSLFCNFEKFKRDGYE